MAKDNEVSRAWILIWCMEDQVFYYKDIAMRIGEEIRRIGDPQQVTCLCWAVEPSRGIASANLPLPF